MIEKVKIISNCELVCVYEQMRKIIKKTFSRKKKDKSNQKKRLTKKNKKNEEEYSRMASN